MVATLKTLPTKAVRSSPNLGPKLRLMLFPHI